MIARTIGGVTYTLGYDAENRLVSVSATNLSAAYTYDGDGSRVKSVVTVGGSTTTTTYIGNHTETTKVNNDPSVLVHYYYAGSQRVAMSRDDVVSYLLGDHLGSTSVTLDVNGVETAELRYRAFGETRYTSGATPTKRQFTGQINEANSVLTFITGNSAPICVWMKKVKCHNENTHGNFAKWFRKSSCNLPGRMLY